MGIEEIMDLDLRVFGARELGTPPHFYLLDLNKFCGNFKQNKRECDTGSWDF